MLFLEQSSRKYSNDNARIMKRRGQAKRNDDALKQKFKKAHQKTNRNPKRKRKSKHEEKKILVVPPKVSRTCEYDNRARPGQIDSYDYCETQLLDYVLATSNEGHLVEYLKAMRRHVSEKEFRIENEEEEQKRLQKTIEREKMSMLSLSVRKNKMALQIYQLEDAMDKAREHLNKAAKIANDFTDSDLGVDAKVMEDKVMGVISKMETRINEARNALIFL